MLPFPVFLASLIATGAPAPAAQGPAASVADSKIVCKSQPGENTRVLTKICKTRSDWARDRARFRDAVEKKQRDSLLNTPRGG